MIQIINWIQCPNNFFWLWTHSVGQNRHFCLKSSRIENATRTNSYKSIQCSNTDLLLEVWAFILGRDPSIKDPSLRVLVNREHLHQNYEVLVPEATTLSFVLSILLLTDVSNIISHKWLTNKILVQSCVVMSKIIKHVRFQSLV